MNITINPELVPVLETQALNDNVTQELWVERKINAFLFSLLKENVVKKVLNKKLEDVKAMDVVITQVDEQIKERDEKPVVVDTTPKKDTIKPLIKA
jgi:hypothetical protein